MRPISRVSPTDLRNRTQTSLPPPSGGKGLFGSATTETPQASSLLKIPVATSQSQGTSSLFGTTQTQTESLRPQQTGGLFGSQNTQQTNGSGLFGGASNTTQSTGGGLFGSQQPQQSSNNMFSGTQQTQPQGGLGLFGSTVGQAQNQQPSNSLFGSATNSNKRSLL